MKGPHAKAGEKQERRRTVSPSTLVVDLPAVPPMPCAALLRIVGIGESDRLRMDYIPCCMAVVSIYARFFILVIFDVRHPHFFLRMHP